MSYRTSGSNYYTTISNHFLQLGTIDENTGTITNILPSKITNTTMGLTVENPTASSEIRYDYNNQNNNVYVAEYTLDAGEYYIYSNSIRSVCYPTLLDNITLNDEEIDHFNLYAPNAMPFTITNNNSELADEIYTLTYEGNGVYTTYLKSGSYNLQISGNQSGELKLFNDYDTILKANQNFSVLNVDTVNPVLNASVNELGQFEFEGKDISGTGADIDSAVSGIDKLYYSEDGENFYKVPEDTAFTYQSRLRAANTINIMGDTLYLYAVDNAGNESDVFEYEMPFELNKQIVYENGKTTLEFWGDEDSEWSDTDYTYSYDITGTETDGHEVSVTEDTDVTAKSVKSKTSPMLLEELVPLEVVYTEAPTIEFIAADKNISVTAGAIENADFKEMYVKVDNGEYVKYTDTSTTISGLAIGPHTITAYQVVTKEGQNITSDKSTLNIEIVGDNNIEIAIVYTNGQTKAVFWSNDDINWSDDFEYSYTIDGVETSGHEVVITEDTTVDFKSTKQYYADGEYTLPLIVIKSDAPNITDIKADKTVDISAGNIEHFSFHS